MAQDLIKSLHGQGAGIVYGGDIIMKKNYLRRAAALVAAGALALSLAACGSSAEETTAAADTEAASGMNTYLRALRARSLSMPWRSAMQS